MPALVRYAALLRGVSPLNAKMTELKAAFEAGGFSDVKTVLGSGNVLFSTRAKRPSALAKQAEAAMQERLGKSFLTLIEPVDDLRALLDEDPWQAWPVPAQAKKVVTFLRDAPTATLDGPIHRDGATIYGRLGRRVFSAYVVSDKGPVFMNLLQKTFGEAITTRTWDTVKKLAR